MNVRSAGLLLAVWIGLLAASPAPQQTQPGQRPASDNPDDPDNRFPRGRKQVEEILKADHVKNVADATDLARLANELKDEMDKTDAQVLSAAALKKAEEIEKLARRIKSRLRH